MLLILEVLSVLYVSFYLASSSAFFWLLAEMYLYQWELCFRVCKFPNVVVKPFWFGRALTRSYLDFRREPVYCSVVDLDESIIHLRGVQIEEFFFPNCVREEDVHRVEVAFRNVEFRPRHVTELLFIYYDPFHLFSSILFIYFSTITIYYVLK